MTEEFLNALEMATRMQLPFPIPGIPLKEVLISSISVQWEYLEGWTFWDNTTGTSYPGASAKTQRVVHVEFTEVPEGPA